MESSFSDPEPNSARFLASVLFTRRRMVRDLMQRLGFLVFEHLLNHIAELRPDIPPEVMRQRLIFLAWYVISIQAALEASITSGRKSREWSEFDPLLNLAHMATGIIEAPISDASELPAIRRPIALKRHAPSAKVQTAAWQMPSPTRGST